MLQVVGQLQALTNVQGHSDALQALEFFMCGEKEVEDAGLKSAFKKLIQGDSYKQGEHGEVGEGEGGEVGEGEHGEVGEGEDGEAGEGEGGEVGEGGHGEVGEGEDGEAGEGAGSWPPPHFLLLSSSPEEGSRRAAAARGGGGGGRLWLHTSVDTVCFAKDSLHSKHCVCEESDPASQPDVCCGRHSGGVEPRPDQLL